MGSAESSDTNVDPVSSVAEHTSSDARRQQQHYDKVAGAYLTNLDYPHTQAYMRHLDRVFVETLRRRDLGRMVELCCGRGEAFRFDEVTFNQGLGVDISLAMLKSTTDLSCKEVSFVQGDATNLPLCASSFDTVVMLGGIHHVPDRGALFREIARVLKPDGCFYWREPANDLFLWRWLRTLIYRASPALDHETEEPLRRRETEKILRAAGLELRTWRSCGLLGFCVFMNSDVLVFNRLFRFVPGIGLLARLSAWCDEWILRIPGLRDAGLQVVGMANLPK